MRTRLRSKVFVCAMASVLFAPAHAGVAANLDYTDAELERLLLSLDVDSKFAALSIVQSGTADRVQRVSVDLVSSVEKASESTILALLGFNLDNSAEINPAKCRDVLARVTTLLLGGKWQEITADGAGSSETPQESKSDLPAGLSSDLQLPDIGRRMIGYVGSRKDVFDGTSFQEKTARWERYIPAYNALKFEVHLTYQDMATGTFTRQRCNSRDTIE